MSIERSIVRTIVFAAVLALIGLTRVDPDLWGHIRFGGDIVRAGTIPTQDPYSFTSDIRWVNHEWLAEIAMWFSWRAGEGAGLIAMKMLLLAGIIWLAWSVLSRAAVPAWATEWLLLVLVFGTWLRTSVIRPQLFSVFLFALLVWILQSCERGHPRRLLCLPLVFAVWINLHGGWIVGFGTFGLWLALTVITGRRPLGLGVLTGLALACAASLLLNPYGVNMLFFIAETVGFDRPDIVDWQPVWHTGIGLSLWIVTATTAAAILIRRWESIPLSHAAIAVGLGFAAVRVVRLDAFFTMAVVFLLGPALGGSVERRAVRARSREAFTLALAMLLVVSAAATFGRGPMSCVGLDVSWAPEREAGAFIQRNRLRGRLISWFGWGQYVIWHFGPDLQVSMDGRRETVYSTHVLQQSGAVVWRPEENLGVLDLWSADYAWLPPHIPLVRTLTARGWTTIFAGAKSVVLSRQPGSFLAAPTLEDAPCFPGP